MHWQHSTFCVLKIHIYYWFFIFSADTNMGSLRELFGTQEVAVKKFLNQDFSGDALAQFRSEVSI